MSEASIGSPLTNTKAMPKKVESYFKKGLRRFIREQPLGVVSAIIIIFLIITAIFASFLAPYSPTAFDSQSRLMAPGSPYFLGTDQIGRDMLSRIIYGARISLVVGFSAVIFGLFFGTILGAVSGYLGGKFDLIFQRIMDAMMAFPVLVLSLAVIAMLGPSVTNVIITIGIIWVPRVARVVRGEVLSAKENDYVQAAKALGLNEIRILARHILPNIASPLIVIATLLLGNSILAEASLSFLGMGPPPPTPTWGLMLGGEARTYMMIAPWLAIYPGLAISITVLAFNLLGDALRDFFDPRLRGV